MDNKNWNNQNRNYEKETEPKYATYPGRNDFINLKMQM